MKRNITRNYAYSLLLSLSNALFPLLTFPYVTRALGVEMYGRVSFVVGLTSMIIGFASLGIPTYGSREIARARIDRRRSFRVFRELVRLNQVGAALGTIVLAFLLTTRSDPPIPVTQMLLALLVIATSWFAVDWLYVGIEAYGVIFARVIATRLAAIILTYILVNEASDVDTYLSIWALSQALSTAIAYFYRRRVIPGSSGAIRPTRHLPAMAISTALFLVNTALGQIDIALLGYLSSEASVGLYAAAYRVYKLTTMLVLALTTVIIPRSAHLYETNQKAEADRMLVISLKYVLLIGLPLATGIAVFSPELLLLVAGEGFSDASRPMAILAVCVPVLGLQNILGAQVLYSQGRDRSVLAVSTVSLVVAVIMDLVLIPVAGASGAAIATLATLAVGLVVQVVLSRSQVLAVLQRLELGRIAIAILSPISVMAGGIILSRGGSISLLGLAGVAVVATGAYVATLLMVREQLTCTMVARLFGHESQREGKD